MPGVCWLLSWSCTCSSGLRQLSEHLGMRALLRLDLRRCEQLDLLPEHTLASLCSLTRLDLSR